MQLLGDGVQTEGKVRIREVAGDLNISTTQRLANIRSSIARGLPQVRGHALHPQSICLVGSGPSLVSSLPALRAAAWAGRPIVAMNGSYGWLVERNIKPTSMVLIDGRPFNARFITEPVAGCSYFLASQCDPALFDKVAGWPNVFIWHCLTGDDPDEKALLDGYYLNAWQPVGGGCTVGLRAIVLFRILGFQRMEIFGLDSCYLEGDGHAMPQPENDADPVETIYCAGRAFRCNSWHVAQYLEFLQLVKANGEHFTLHVHGDGLIAHAIKVLADDTTPDDLMDEAKGAD